MHAFVSLLYISECQGTSVLHWNGWCELRVIALDQIRKISHKVVTEKKATLFTAYHYHNVFVFNKGFSTSPLIPISKFSTTKNPRLCMKKLKQMLQRLAHTWTCKNFICQKEDNFRV